MRRRAGFTLVEMIVVIGVVSVILALMLPTLLSGMEAARRTQCLNNIKQLQLALQCYESTHGSYPSGIVDSVRPFSPSSTTQGLSWIAMLLPQTEQYMVYGTLNFEVGALNAANTTGRGATINALLCPTSRSRNTGNDQWWRRGGFSGHQQWRPAIGFSSYVGVHHDVEKAIDSDDHGVLFLNSRIRSADVFDGLSQTLVFGELAAPTAEGWLAGGRSTLRNTGSAINQINESVLGEMAKTPAWTQSDQTFETLETLIEEGRISLPDGYVGGFSSLHQGNGAIFAFGDGSVRFLKATIDPTVYQRLGHRDDGEPIHDDAY